MALDINTKNIQAISILAKRDDIRIHLERWLSIKRLSLSDLDSWLRSELKREVESSGISDDAHEIIVKSIFGS